MDDNSTGIPKNSELHNYAVNGKVMLCSVIVLFAVVLFFLFCQYYIRWLATRVHNGGSLPIHRHPTNRPILFSINPTAEPTVFHRGLDPVVLKSLPTFIYSAAAYPRGLECAVCLSEFEDSEAGRLLPDCNHCFHVQCIDMWFRAHSNCPLCRAPLRRKFASNTARSPREIVVSGSMSDMGFGGLDNDGGHRLSLLPVECRRNALELTDITPEKGRGSFEGLRTRRDIEEEGIGSPGGSGSKSNGVFH
ncbi:hypothetical protein Ancab_019570 [Ancistrocladus abbreviatus]